VNDQKAPRADRLVQVIAELPVFSDVSLLEDAEVVYRALLRRSPQKCW
jgi:hypothetical protein